MTDDEIRAKGWSVPIYRAVEAAGGPVAVSYHMGFAAYTTPMSWYKRRSIKMAHVVRLCRLGGDKVTPSEIIADIAERLEERAAA